MKRMKTIPWHHFWASNFYKLNQDDVQVWDIELRRKIRGLTSPEIIAGIQHMSDRSDLWPDFPKARHLVAAILGLRDLRRLESETAKQCEYCGGCGWISYTAARPGMGLHSIGVPCICERGKRIMAATYPPEEHSRLREYSATAAKQAKERQA